MEQQQPSKSGTGQAAASLPLASSILGAFFASATAGKKAAAKGGKSGFLELGSNSSKLSYLPMLSMPVVAAPALVAMRALVQM